MQGYPNSPGRMEAFWRSIDEEVNGSKKAGINCDAPLTRTGSVASACRAVPQPEFYHRHGRNSHHSIAASKFNEFPRLQHALREGGGGGESPPLTSPLDEFPTPPSFVASPTSRYDRQRPSVGSLPMTVHSGTSFLDFDDEERRQSGHTVGRAL
ncbi:hypothetical protein PM082_019430 [Marasmius tenuissimus]|nr:hypothetical protein PM082_019430 [Marasmius tenuissimus]